MSAGETLRSLADRGFRLRVRGDTLRIEPTPDAATIAALRSQKATLLPFIAEHGGIWPIPRASEHRYVAWSGTADRSRSVCLSCGIPPTSHGAGALEDPFVIDNPDDAPLIQAEAIVACAIAERFPTANGSET